MTDRNSAEILADLSTWIDNHPPNKNASRNEQLWGRTAKIGEEFGETISEVVAFTGQNPRKGYSGSLDKITKELLDVAVTALAAVEHITGNHAYSLELLDTHIINLAKRAGI